MFPSPSCPLSSPPLHYPPIFVVCSLSFSLTLALVLSFSHSNKLTQNENPNK